MAVLVCKHRASRIRNVCYGPFYLRLYMDVFSYMHQIITDLGYLRQWYHGSFKRCTRKRCRSGLEHLHYWACVAGTQTSLVSSDPTM